MTDYLKTLTAFLGQLGLPVYQEGRIPEGAAFPCAAMSAEDAAYGEPAAVRLTGWYRGAGANRQATVFLDAVAALVPEGGVLLPLTAGSLLVTRAEAFRSTATDRDAIGGRAALEVRRYAVD